MKLSQCITYRSISKYFDLETNACVQQNHYEILGITKDASEKDIRAAYIELARTEHPDKHHGTEAKKRATEQFKRMNEAYMVLSDPARRKRVDEFLERTKQSQFSNVSSMTWDQAMTIFLNVFGECVRRQQEINPSGLHAILSFGLPSIITFITVGRPESSILSVGAGIITLMSLNNDGYQELMSEWSMEEKQLFVEALSRLLDSHYLHHS